MAGTLGAGAAACNPGGGGGGGGGLYGGGGGAWGGGGGGSSFTDPILATGVTHTRGCNIGPWGQVTITVLCNAGGITGTLNVCPGQTTTLTDTTGGSSGTWTSSTPTIATVGSTTGVVTGISAGVSTITYTVTLACGTVYTTAVVTVNPTPPVITGTASVCIGATTTLSDGIAGGTWTSSTTGVATIVPGTGVVTGISTGTSFITYTLPTGCYRTTTVTVNPNPLAITGTASMCIGATTTLSDATPGGAWTSGIPTVATVSIGTGLVTGISPGLSTITYTLPTGCYATRVVTVYPTPTFIAGLYSVCVGSATLLTGGPAGGTWTSVPTTVATIGSSSGIVTGISPGTSTITYRLFTGCTLSTTITVYGLPGAITGITSLCVGSTTTLSDTSVGGSWSSGDTSIATVDPFTGIVTGITPGVDTITFSLFSTGCSSTTTVTVNSSPAIISGAASICIGTTIGLTDPTIGGTWSTSSPLIATVGPGSGIVTGIGAGIATITYMMPTGCYATTAVTVNPGPAIITGPTNVCVGLTITEADATSGGTWSSGSPLIASIAPGTGVVTGVATGTAVITYRLPSGCFATTTITVNNAPSSITGVASVCVGQTTALSDGTPGGTWTSGATGTATVGPVSGIVTGIAPGTVVITYSLGSSCSTTIRVTVNALPPAIGGPATVCAGSVITETDGTPGGTWTSTLPAIATIGAGTGIVAGIAIGTTTIAYTLATGCRATKIITVNPSPSLFTVTGGGNFCAGGSGVHVGLTGSAAGIRYQLYYLGVTLGAPVTGTGLPIDFGSFTGAGTYTVIATSATTGCSITMTGSAIVAINPLPTAFTVTGGGRYCAGGTGVHVGLSFSNPGVNYQLLLGGIGVGAPVPGIGGLIDFGLQTAPGTYTVTAINTATGCSNTMLGSVTIAINPLPASIIGPTALCAGTSITLTDATPGGGWTSSTPSVATIGGGTGIVSGIATGLTTITYTLPLTTCYTTLVVTVTPGPGPILGPSNLCIGNTITLTDAVPGGTWSSSATAIASIGSLSGAVLGIASGPATITYTLGGTSCTVTKTITVSPGPAVITGAASLCVGTTTTLGDATPLGTWSSVSPTIATITGTGLVTGISAGTSTISYLAGGCAATKIVTVNPIPTLISGPLQVCVGSTATLIDGVGGGTWSSVSTGIATISPLTGVVTGISRGTSVISYSLGAGCNTGTVITVNPLPAAISGTSNICAGLSVTFTDATPGGTWSSSATGIATVGATTGVVMGVSTGVVTISYALTATGCAATMTVNITPVPGIITGAASVCVGQTSLLSDAPSGGTWSSVSPSIATISPSTGLVTGVASGTSTVIYTAGGCNATTVVTVIPTPAAIAGLHNVCVGMTITLTDPTTGGTWGSSIATIATVGTGTGIVSGVSSGTTIITYSLSSGCQAVLPIVVNPISQILGNPTVCVGQTTTLTDTTLGGVWSSGSTAIATVSPAGIVTGAAAGTTAITYTLLTGCYTTKTVTINAIPLPIVGASYLCVGATTTLTDPSPTGTWSSSNPAVGNVNTSGVVTGVSAGAATISYTYPSGCPAMKVVTVYPLPTAIAGPNVVCIGSTINLTDATPGGVWTSSSPAATIGFTTGLVTGISLGTSTIAYTFAGTGCATTTNVTVNTSPAAITGTMNVCVGLTTALSDATPGGTWSSLSPAIATIDMFSGLVTGVSPGSVLITYSPGTGCTATAVVTVNPLPSGITGPANVCQGSTVTLHDATPGGTWSSSSTSVATIGAGTGVVTGIATGTVTITYTAGSGCFTTTTLFVDPAPAPIAGSATICVGLTSSLTDATPGGTWSSSNIPVAPVSPSGVVTGVALGTATISYALGTGCAVNTVVTVNPFPLAITGNPTVCVGATTTLSDGVSGGSWSSSSTATATVGAGSGTITGVSAGIATITYTTGAGCFTTVDVTVNALPAAVTGPNTVCATQSITLSDATPGGTWSSGTTAIATVGSSTGDVIGVAAGTVTISYTAGCSATYIVTVNAMPAAITGNLNVCLAGTSTLSDAVPGGTWFSSNPSVATVGTSSGMVTGVSLGSCTIVYQLAGSCFVSVLINVYPLPIAYGVTGGGNRCSSDSGVHIGLTNSAIGVNYLLYLGATAVGTFPGTGTALDFGLLTVGGTYTVIGTSTATGCSISMTGSAIINVTLSVTPSVAINANPNDTVCAGATATFTPVPSNGGTTPTYIWSVNTYPVSLAGSYSYIPANGDVVSVTLTSNMRCANPVTATRSVTMTVQPFAKPTVAILVSPRDTVCSGTPVTLNTESSYSGSAPVYSWIKNRAPAGGGATYTYVPNDGDVVYCVMNSNYACRLANSDTANSVTISVVEPVLPIVTINANPGTIIGIGQPDTLTASAPLAISPTYQWYINGIPVSGATTSTYVGSSFSYPNEDSVSCMVTSNGVCTVITHQWVYIDVTSVGVKQITLTGSDINILPNPNTGTFTVKGSLGTTNDEAVSFEITDLLGQVVYKNNVIAKNGKLNEQIKLGSTIANGTYILTVQSEIDSKVFHVVIEQ